MPTTADNDKTVDLYNANDGVHGRDGGPYLDEVEAVHWEKHHAARDGSEPDLEHPRSYPGIVLRNKGQQVAEFNPLLLAGDDRRDNAEFTAQPYATDVPVVATVQGDLNPDAKPARVDKKAAPEIKPDQPLTDNPQENKIEAFKL